MGDRAATVGRPTFSTGMHDLRIRFAACVDRDQRKVALNSNKRSKCLLDPCIRPADGVKR